MSAIEAHQRPSACVLAIASRLAPLTGGESDHQLRTFLTGLPGQVLEATAKLAARTLPELEPVSPGAGNPAELITTRLRVLRLVGTHRASPP